MLRNLPTKIILTAASVLIAFSAYLVLLKDTGIPKNTQPEAKTSNQKQNYIFTAPEVKNTCGFEELLKKVEDLQSLGKLSSANQTINDYMSKNKSGMDKSSINQLEFELERSKRIALDYPL